MKAFLYVFVLLFDEVCSDFSKNWGISEGFGERKERELGKGRIERKRGKRGMENGRGEK